MKARSDPGQATGQVPLAVEVDQPVLAGPAGQARGRLLAPSLHQDLDLPTHPLAVLLFGDPVLQIDQAVQPLHPLRLGHLVGEEAARSPGPGRVGEHEGRIEAGLFDHLQGPLELGLGLAGEADDDVGGDSQVGKRLAQPLHQVEELLAGIAALHAGQDLIVAGLQGKVDVLADRRVGRHGLDHPRGEPGRVRRGEAEPVGRVELAQRLQQVRELDPGLEVPPVVVDVLAQEHDLAVAQARQATDLGHHLGHRAAAQLAPDVGHDAVGAPLVAAHRDGDHRAEGPARTGLQLQMVALPAHLDEAALARLHALDQLR